VASIVLVDDDYNIEIVADQLRYLGHVVTRFSSADRALESIDQIAASDLLILDMMMSPPTTSGASAISGGLTSGMTVFTAARRLRADLPILAFTASSDPRIREIMDGDEHAKYWHKWHTPSISEFLSEVQSMLGLEMQDEGITAFIVHGHDDRAKLEVKNYLQNTLGLPEPIILHEQPNIGRTIMEKFENYSATAHIAVVILTPDDVGSSVDATDDEKRRARQNVIFELGYFLGVLGRASGRVILLHKGQIELPSDISGLVYIDISEGVEAAGEMIRREIEHAFRR
jgi:CheY-like chemotaxis protein